MNQQTTNTKGVYAGLLPADFAMMIRRQPLGEKLTAGAVSAPEAVRNDRPGTQPQT